MEPEEDTGELEAASATVEDQTDAFDDQGEASEEEQASPDESDEGKPGADPDTAYTVTIDGEERTLSRAEIESGMLLQKAFTQKSQGLAEERRQWEGTVGQTREALSREVEKVKGWLEFSLAQQPKEPDWAAIAAKSPAEWVQQKARWESEQAHRNQAQAMYQEIRSQETARQQEAFVSDLYREFPAWRDQAVMVKEVGEIYTAASQYGLSKGDVDQMMDPRAFKVLKDAAAYRALQAKKPEIQARVVDAPKKPPVRATGGNGDGAVAVKAAFTKKPTMDNAVKLDF